MNLTSPTDLAACGPLATAAAPDGGNARRRLWLLPPLLLGLLAGAALLVDLPAAQWAHGRDYPRWARELMSLAEALGHGVGVAIVLLIVYTLDPARRGALPRAILMVAAGGCGANLLKLLVSRTRPGATDLPHSLYWQTFGGWLPLGHGGSGCQSFPSAHTAAAAALALALAGLYPQGRRLFAAFVAAVGVQRVLGGAHYPSDVLAGAAVGWLCAFPLLTPLAAKNDASPTLGQQPCESAA